MPQVHHPPPGFAVLPPTSLRSLGEKTAIHILGMTIDPNTPTHRRRLIGWQPANGPPGDPTLPQTLGRLAGASFPKAGVYRNDTS